MWQGDLKSGEGTVALGSGAYSFQSRFEAGTGTNPEELIAAAHAGCYSMAFSQAGHPPKRVHTTAKIHLQQSAGGFSIPKIELVCEAEVPGLDAAAFKDQAEQAKKNCPVSKLLAATEITLDANLVV